MTTALQICTDAAAELGIIGASESLSGEDASVLLRYLNRILQKWSNMRLLVWSLTETSVSTTGAASYSISSRPIKVQQVTCIDSEGVEYPVYMLSRAEWDALAVKDVDGGPVSKVFYDQTYPSGTLYVYPKANGYTLKLDGLALIQALSLDSTLAMPPGYEAALVPALACEVAGLFDKQVSPDLMRRTAAAVRVLKRTNHEPVLMTQELAVQEQFDVVRGY